MDIRAPHQIELLINKLANEYSRILGDNFVGFYVHGSLAMGCYNIKRSDIDFLVVVKESLDIPTKHEIIDFLIMESEDAPGNGFEMSIIKQSELYDFKYPTPFELHFSRDHLEKYKTIPDYICGDDADPDLAAHLMITKKRGIVILGSPIDDVFLEIPCKYYQHSIIGDSLCSLDNISKGPDTGTCDAPPYAILNICRVLAYLEDRLITSKCEGGEWGLAKLPKKYHHLIQQALNTYSSLETEVVQCALLKEFGRYAENRFRTVTGISLDNNLTEES
ncbi:MAG: aminoglycoside adenylyltransferase domain-containing protein [Armatimonadota bacterium]